MKEQQPSLAMVGSIDEHIPQRHPIRHLKILADRALASMNDLFEGMYAHIGWPSVAPERLLKAQQLIALFSVRSDRQFCEQLENDLLLRWFLDIVLDETAFDASTLFQNPERLIRHRAGDEFLAAVICEAKSQHLLSKDHSSVDGTLIEAWASLRSFRPKGEPLDDSNGWSDFRGEQRSDGTHESRTDPEARLGRKGKGLEAKLSYCGNILMESRHGLIVDVDLAIVDGKAERNGASRLLKRRGKRRARRTVAADKGFDPRAFVDACRELEFTPNLFRNQHGTHSSAIEGRTTGHRGYVISMIVRRRIEQIFGWLKSCGGLRNTRFRGLLEVGLDAYLTAVAHNLLKLVRLITAKAPA